MARKKNTEQSVKTVDTSHVRGLSAEVMEQPITDSKRF